MGVSTKSNAIHYKYRVGSGRVLVDQGAVAVCVQSWCVTIKLREILYYYRPILRRLLVGVLSFLSRVGFPKSLGLYY